MKRVAAALTILGVAVAVLFSTAVASQDWSRREFPLAPPNSTDNFVAPYFDGYHKNDDGTYTLSFGFMNRNDEEVIEIPLGPNNFIEPAEFDGNQPTTFPVVSYTSFGGPRERGVFTVVVPADFEGDVWWNLTTGGYSTRVPGRLVSPGLLVTGAYELSTSPMAAGSLRPAIRFSEDGPDFSGLTGEVHPEEFTTTVGEPIEVRFWAFDRGERELGGVNLTLWKYQGPVGGKIAFESLTSAPGARGGRGTLREPGPVATRQIVRIPTEGPQANMGHFKATFDTPGEYMIRIRVDNFGVSDSRPGNQCCWSNAYVKVHVEEGN